MPEDLRTKESDALNKKRGDLQIDLIVPDGQAKTKKTGQSWWQKFLSGFKRPPHFIEPVKPVVEHKKSEKTDKHSKDFDIELDKPREIKDLKVKEVYHKVEEKKPITNNHDLFFVKGLSNDRPSKWLDKDNQEKVVSNQATDMFDGEASAQPAKTQIVSPVLAKETIVPKPPVEAPKVETSFKTDFSIPSIASDKKIVKPELQKEVKIVKESKFHQPSSGLGRRFIDNGGGVDLIPVAVRTRSWRQISALFVLSIIGSALIVGIFYGALFVQGKNIANEEAAKASQISDLEKQILDYEELNKEIQKLGSDITLVNDVLNKHIYWTNFFALLEKYTISDVYYRGLAAGNNGALTLKAVGKDFSSVAKQLKVLEQESAKEFVTEAKVTAAEDMSSGVEFEITLVLNPNLFYYDNQAMGGATSTDNAN